MSILRHIADRMNGKAPPGKRRSPKWAALERQWLKDHPYCEVCEGTEFLTVHHKVPFHVDQSKELDITNLITLCESGHHGVNCHLIFGHRGNFQKTNDNCVADVAVWKAKLTQP